MSTAVEVDAKAEGPAETDPPRSRKKLFVIAGAAAAVMALGGAGALLYTRKPAEAGKERAAEAQKAKAAPSFIAFEPLIVNLRDEEAERMMQIAFSFESADSKAAEAVKVHTPAIRNRLILLLTSKSSRDIAGREGKERLAAEILAEARAAMGATKEAPLVEAVHFTSIIVQ